MQTWERGERKVKETKDGRASCGSDGNALFDTVRIIVTDTRELLSQLARRLDQAAKAGPSKETVR